MFFEILGAHLSSIDKHLRRPEFFRDSINNDDGIDLSSTRNVFSSPCRGAQDSRDKEFPRRGVLAAVSSDMTRRFC